MDDDRLAALVEIRHQPPMSSRTAARRRHDVHQHHLMARTMKRGDRGVDVAVFRLDVTPHDRFAPFTQLGISQPVPPHVPPPLRRGFLCDGIAQMPRLRPHRRGYRNYRRPDPRTVIVAPPSASPIINVGAESAPRTCDRRHAVEPSRDDRATVRAPRWQACADALPSPPAFDGAMAMLTIHHWPRRRARRASWRASRADGSSC
jgi:hypothetical protein